MTSDRLSRDKQSLLSEVQAVRDELEINSFIRKGAGEHGIVLPPQWLHALNSKCFVGYG